MTEPSAGPGTAFLDVRRVSKIFGAPGKSGRQVQALQDVSFQAAPREFLSIVGPSGCGKSTLLRLVDGLEKPDGGQVLLGGRPVRSPGLDRGVVFQSPNLLPWRTIVRNVEFGLESKRLPRSERRKKALELLEIVGLGGFSSFYPSQLSGGMQQRVGLARALAIDPAMLLMDEPFAAVDAQTKLILQEELEKVWLQTEKAVLFITHDIEEAIFLADRVLVMSRGPGRIIDTVEVDFPRPRNFDLRGTPEFAGLVHRVLEGLRAQVSSLKPAALTDSSIGEVGP